MEASSTELNMASSSDRIWISNIAASSTDLKMASLSDRICISNITASEIDLKMASLSDEEILKLSFEYWYQKQVGVSVVESTKENARNFLQSALPQIQRAYVSIKKAGYTTISEFLNDEIYMSSLFQIGYALSSLKEFQITTKSMTYLLLNIDPSSSSSALDEPEKSPPSKRLRADYSSFTKFQTLLLISEEILAQLDIHQEIDTNQNRRIIMDGPCKCYIDFLEAGVTQLRCDVRQSESMLLEVLKNTLDSSPLQTDDWLVAHSVAGKLFTLTRKLNVIVGVCGGYMGARDKFLDYALGGVSRLLNLSVDPVSGEKDFYYQKFGRVLERLAKKN